MLNKLKSEAYNRGLTDVKPKINNNNNSATSTKDNNNNNNSNSQQKQLPTVSALSSKEDLIAFIRTQTDSARTIKSKLTSIIFDLFVFCCFQFSIFKIATKHAFKQLQIEHFQLKKQFNESNELILKLKTDLEHEKACKQKK